MKHILHLFFIVFITSTILHAQKKQYEKEWEIIESLEVEGKVTSALEKVDALRQKTINQKNEVQHLKCLLFRWKFLQIIDEKSSVTILQEVRKGIEIQSFPNKQLLHMYMASFLETYLNDNYWKISQRTATEDAAIKNYQTWDQSTFLQQISKHYKEALRPGLALANIPTEKMAPLLVTVPINRKNKPTVYDIIAHQALDFYKNTRYRVQLPKDEFLINNETYFVTSADFVKQKITTTDTHSLLYQALLTYQQLEFIHSQRKNKVALIHNALERLQIVKSNFKGIDTEEKYLSALENLLAENNSNKNSGNNGSKISKGVSKIELELAKAYRTLSFEKNKKEEYKYADYNQKALDLISKVETGEGEIATKIEAKNLKVQILQRKLNWLTQDKHLPNQAHLAKITFTNAEKATVNAYRIPFDYQLNNLNYYDRDSILETYLGKRKLVFSKTYDLPKKKDFNAYSTEVIVPKLPLGNYIFRVQTDTLTNSYKYHHLQVTELSVNKTAENNYTNYQVLHRYKGVPIANAAVVVKTAIDRRNKEFRTTNYSTDKWGAFSHRNGNRYENNTILIQTNKDTLSIRDNSYRRRENGNYDKELNQYQSKVLLFLDRAIYRPSQTVYFKAIAISEENQKSGIIANKVIDILVSDPNGEKVFETTLNTNAYGSVQGELKLPDAGLNGQFTIRATLQNPKNPRKHQNSYQTFAVEEYKRPTFEVTFAPATEIYKPLDSIKVQGNVKAFLGSNITEASVAYSVTRTTQHRYWWYYSHLNNASKQVASGITTTDEKGGFTIPFKAITDEEDAENKIYHYSIVAKVTDLNGETREQTTAINVAYKNLVANILTDENWEGETTPELSLEIKDINGNPITANGNLKIYKLKSTGRFLNNRPWQVPDIQTIAESEFKTNFPHIPFTDEKDPKNWKKGKLVFEQSFTNTSNATINVASLSNWHGGKYVITTSVTDPKTKSNTTAERAITLQQPKQDFPADEEVFIYQTIYSKNDPSKVSLQLQTAAPELIVFTEIFDGDKSIWKEKITLKKGNKEVPVRLPKLKFPKATVTYKYQLYNQFYSEWDVLNFTAEPIVLEIEKKHFRDKINPGTPEKWLFKIQRSDNNPFQAEALASMYDASLDTFKQSNWNANFGFGKYYPSPSFAQAINALSTTSINFSEPLWELSRVDSPNEKLDFFGFQFNQINSWKYRSYLQQLIVKRNPNQKNNTITGIVYDGNLPLPGVAISIKNKNEGTITDFDGVFTLNVKKGDVLQVSYIGYKTKEILFSNQKELHIELEEDLSSLEEVVVIGYAKRKGNKPRSRSIKSAVAPEQMMQGRTAGVEMIMDEAVFEEAMFEEVEMDEDIAADFELPKEETADLRNIQARANLQETAFFLPNLRTNAKGEIEFEFTSPEALTQWNFRMLAHTKDAIAGKLTAQTLTQKELSIITNAPRFVREGDQLHFTAKVANLTKERLSGIALLEWTDPTNGKSIDDLLKLKNATQKFNIDAEGNNLLTWEITIPENLTAMQYKIVAKANNYTDGEEKIIPVLSNRMLVTESVPLWVRAGETEQFSLTNFEPNSNTQKAHQITLEYTSNPAWMAIKSLPYLMEFPHDCSEQTFSRLYANAIATHILNSQPKIKAVFESWKNKGTLQSPLETNEELKNILLAESPWLQEAKTETEQQQRLAQLFDLEKTARDQQKAFNKLRQLQKSNGGFPWFSGGYANAYITRHIVAGLGHLEKLGVTPQQTKTDFIVKNAIQFLDNELINDYNAYLKHHQTAEGFYKQTSLLHLAYARSFYHHHFPLKGEAKNIIDKALNYQEANWQSRSVYEKGLLALVLHRFRKSAVTQQILTALTESAVNSKANGMYWKENTASWWWYQNPITTQSLLIEAFAETNQPKKYVEEMKVFLLKNKRTNRWETTVETTDACYALLLQGNDWLSIQENTVIEVGGNKIKTTRITETEKEQGTGYLKTSWKSEEITPAFKNIKVTNKSEVTSYGGYYWQYFEDLDQIKTDDKNPLALVKELYKKVTTNKGTELQKITSTTPLNMGDKVTVRLLINSADDLEFVHLKDMRASGLEPVKVLSGYEYKDGIGYYQSTKDVATHFFIDYLQKGNYVLEYDVIANQAGSFSNGITTLQCMYAPEYSSHSAGIKVEILK